MYRISSSTCGPVLGMLVLSAGAFVPAHRADAATRVVSNCNDSGAGSLRAVVLNATSGDVIDLRSLGCNRILLTTGAIVVPHANLTIVGRGRYAFTIDGGQRDRVFLHTAFATLRLERMSIANGRRIAVLEEDRGGCIRSGGNVELHQARVHDCLAHSDGFLDSPPTFGGGISAQGSVTLIYSSVFNSRATETGTGGGIFAEGRATLYRSQVYDNFAFITGGVSANRGVSVAYSRVYRNRATAGGGGLASGLPGTSSDLLINKSTISNNVLDDFEGRNIGARGGGLVVNGTGRRVITDSTFSGNRAYFNSAAYIEGTADIYNSTIAHNVEIQTLQQDFPSTACEFRGALRADVLHLESSIVARNTCTIGPVGYDISGEADMLLGANNLIGRSRIPIPPDTITADPRLAPLGDNGGPSWTHMLLSDSPALNRGSNLLDRAYDQRGPGFPRVTGAFPDIGAVER